MSIEQTLSIIKPDATKRNITGSINELIEKNKSTPRQMQLYFHESFFVFTLGLNMLAKTLLSRVAWPF